MGLSLHYQGSLGDSACLSDLLSDIADGLSKLESRAETPEDLACEIEAFFRERFEGRD